MSKHIHVFLLSNGYPDSQKMEPRKKSRKPAVQRPTDLLPLYADDSDADEGSILILNEPRSARKPIRRAHISAVNKTIPSFPITRYDDGSPHSNCSGKDKRQVDTPREILGITPQINKPPPRTPTRRKAEEQAHREKYAAQLFEEYNNTIFDNGLPRETKLNWNKRLLTTAGRAKWHKSRDGVQTTEIELAAKILDCDERIRNTLSHECVIWHAGLSMATRKKVMGRPSKPGRANKVMIKYPEINITTRHNYEICTHLNGNANSAQKYMGDIANPSSQMNAVGKLIPLFEQRAPRTPKVSRMATALPQGSPRPVAALEETGQIPANGTVCIISSEDEVDILIGAVNDVTLHDGETSPRAI
ncbi:hypothetical protein BDR07DRAFT_1478264 [Suillus spraguei]|nr:hypothetical protein BDR07DRAFT_1478264 [Suillus spraguei]